MLGSLLPFCPPSFFPPCYLCLWCLLFCTWGVILCACPRVGVRKPKANRGISSSTPSPPYLWDKVYNVTRSSLFWLEWLASELPGSSHLCSLALGLWIYFNAQLLCGCWRSELRSCLLSPFCKFLRSSALFFPQPQVWQCELPPAERFHQQS